MQGTQKGTIVLTTTHILGAPGTGTLPKGFEQPRDQAMEEAMVQILEPQAAPPMELGISNREPPEYRRNILGIEGPSYAYSYSIPTIVFLGFLILGLDSHNRQVSA